MSLGKHDMVLARFRPALLQTALTWCGFRPPLLHFVLVLWILVARSVLAGHEVLYKTELRPGDLLPHELAVMQFDSRVPLADYWAVAAHWNKVYCAAWGHEYLFLSMRGACFKGALRLHPAWCKVGLTLTLGLTPPPNPTPNPTPQVKAMLDVEALLPPRIRAVLYLDRYLTLNRHLTLTPTV